jgi:hypothetical protein
VEQINEFTDLTNLRHLGAYALDDDSLSLLSSFNNLTTLQIHHRGAKELGGINFAANFFLRQWNKIGTNKEDIMKRMPYGIVLP